VLHARSKSSALRGSREVHRNNGTRRLSLPLLSKQRVALESRLATMGENPTELRDGVISSLLRIARRVARAASSGVLPASMQRTPGG
jgi:hypothetical protein